MDRIPPHQVRRVAVVGTGLIGAGWTVWFLARGLEVIAWDPAPGARRRLESFIREAWPVCLELGAAPGADPSRWSFAADAAAVAAEADFIQENGPDREEVKRAIFADLDRRARSETVIASSSSALLMTPIQGGLGHPGRCVLGHPFNPPHLIPLVEVSGGAATDEAALDWAMAFYRHIGKVPVRLKREIHGHIAGRLAAAVWQEAVHLVEAGIADVEAVDLAMAYGPGLRYAVNGPHMTYHLGGGDGGLRRFIDHLGPGQERRWRSLGRPRLTPELARRLVEGVEREAGGRTVAELERSRNQALVAILKALMGTTRGT